MRTKISGIILTFLIALSQTASYSFDYSNCTFTYQPITENEFNFTQCTYSTCTAWFRGQSTGTCTQSENHVASDWGTCTRTCCDPSATYPQNMNSIKQCQDYLDSSTKNAIIVGSFVGSLFFIALCIMIGCCICKCQKCRGCRDRCIKCCPICVKCIDCACCKRKTQNLDEKPNSKSMEAVGIENETEVRRPVWRGGLKQSVQKLQIPCFVCLHPKPSVQLSCGHFFHRNCIAECLVKKKECAMCRSTNLMARVFCEDCFESFYEVSLAEHKLDTSSKRIICTGCGSQFTIE